MSGFSAKEFEPDPAAVPDDDDDDASGAAPGPGHNRRGKPTEHAKIAQTMLGLMHSRGEALRNIHDLQKRSHLWYYRDGLWTMLPEPAKWLNHAIEVTLRAMGKAHKSKDKLKHKTKDKAKQKTKDKIKKVVKHDMSGKAGQTNRHREHGYMGRRHLSMTARSAGRAGLGVGKARCVD